MILLDAVNPDCFDGRGKPLELRTDDELDIALRFVRGQLTYGQAARRLGMSKKSGSSAGVHLLAVLRRAIAEGRAHVMVLR